MAAREEIGNEIGDNGEAELGRRAYEAYLKTGRTDPFLAFDIGANLGEWTRALLANAPNSRVEMFEPAPAAYRGLCERFAGDARVKIHDLAVSSRIGETTMYLSAATAGTNGLTPRHAASEIGVRLTTIQAQLERIGAGHVDLIKMDAEGHDIEILRGASEILRAGTAGVIQFEYNHLWIANRGSLFEVFEMVKGTRYSVARVTRRGPVIFDSWNPELDRYFEANYALIRDDIAKAMGIRRTVWSASNVAV